MNSTRTTVIAAAAAVVLWTVKGVAIAAAGGLGKSPFEGPLFLAGLISSLVACAALVLGFVHHRQWWGRAGAVLAAFVAVVAGVAAFGVVVDSLATSDHWAWSELNLWVLSVALLAAGVWRSGRVAAA